MLRSSCFHHRILINESHDINSHVAACLAHIDSCHWCMIREVDSRIYKLHIKHLEDRVFTVPMAGLTPIAPSAADWPHWFMPAIELVKELYVA